MSGELQKLNPPPWHLQMLAAVLRGTQGWPLRDRVAQRLDRRLAEQGWVLEHESDGLRCHLELDDTVCRGTYIDDGHEVETGFYLKHLIRPGNRLWDVGACHGFVSLRMAQLAGAAGRVDAFEPVTANRLRMEKNLRLNPDLAARITVHPYALSHEAGRVMMQRTSGRNPGASHIVTEKPAEDKGRERAGVAGTEMVETRAAEAVWQETGATMIHGVKIDVEGHELQVLAGMGALVKEQPPRWFLIEVRDTFLRAAGGSREEVFAWFAERGYVAQRLVPGRTMVPDMTPRDAAAVLFLYGEEGK
ncbi:MAG TPA: FkbM family methyltransferase [Verrucomicrobiae bacterium]